MIPRRLIRSVPTVTTDEVEGFWAKAAELHPNWELVTWRDPIDPTEFPRTAAHWSRCSSGAQMAGLIRLEALWIHGGIWIDSDLEPYRRFDSLLDLRAFACWQDPNTIPDAVLGAEVAHPAIDKCIELALPRLEEGAHRSGPDVITQVFKDRDDVLLLPPGSFYPYHWTERQRRHENHKRANPWAFGAHHWNASWLR